MPQSLPLAANYIAALLFAIAVLHTFSTGIFTRLAHHQPAHAGLWHLLGEVEAVFGFWAFILVIALVLLVGSPGAVDYLQSQNYTEPMFVFVIMVIAASRPILEAIQGLIRNAARLLPVNTNLAAFMLTLSVVPLAGSFITEPAAMTLAALILREAFFKQGLKQNLQYATVGALFVNVSIGGTLTPFAAPPVLMVAGKWGWDISHMLLHFGWKSALAVIINALVVTLLFRKEISAKGDLPTDTELQRIPHTVTIINVLFLCGVVIFAHHPVVFMGLFLFFLGFTEAYPHHQGRLILRESLMVGFFLAGLVTLGSLQQWWLKPALSGIDSTVLYFVATALTAITDNAALTYLGSLVEGTDAAFKYALVAGAVTGGGLTVIANAPNPAGFAILKHYFPDGTISPLKLFLAASLPTVVAIFAFLGLRGIPA